MRCTVCGKDAELICQRCSEPYCSDYCQDTDWLRHKQFCITKPPLIPANLKILSPHKENTSILGAPKNEIPTLGRVLQGCSVIKTKSVALDSSTTLRTNVASAILPFDDLKPLWREYMLPNRKEIFECQVSSVENDGTFWVVDSENSDYLERLTKTMAANLDNLKPRDFKDLAIDALVVACIEEKYFRAQVLEICAETKEVNLRLIDYGVVVKSKERQIYSPFAGLEDIKAFAFRVKFPSSANPNVIGNVHLNKILILRLLGTKAHNGIFQVVPKPKSAIPLNLPLQLLNNNPEITFVKILETSVGSKEPQVALVQINVMSNINKDLNDKLKNMLTPLFTGPYPEDARIFFCAARGEKGFRRVFLIDYIEDPKSYFLVYEMDEGHVTITTEMRRIPNDLLDYPIRVFALTMPDGQDMTLQDALTAYGKDLAIKFKSEACEKDNTRMASAKLLAGDKPICSVRASTFLGPIADVGIKYWRETICNNSLVYITHVFSPHEISISSGETKQYSEILQFLEPKCKPFKNFNHIPIGCIVLVVCPKLGHFRGEITADLNGLYAVYNIDTGATHEVSGDVLRMPCRFIENMPVSLIKTKLKTICDLPLSAMPEKSEALHSLQEYCKWREEFRVKFDEPMNTHVDLLPLYGDQRSLVTRLLPLVFTAATTEAVLGVGASLPAATEPKDLEASAVSGIQSLSMDKTPSPESKKKTSISHSFLPLPLSPPSSPQPKPNTINTLPPVDVPHMLEASLAGDMKTVERYYYSDLDKFPVPKGSEINVMLLNAAGLQETGYISVCYFPNEKVAENFQNLLDLVGHHGKCTHNIMPGFMPGVGEMCLALFSEDNCWYRGVCIKTNKTSATILYCDFGNVAIVAQNQIKPISNDLLQAIYCTKCYIRGFDKTQNYKLFEEYIVRHGNVCCTVEDGPDEDSRYITVPQIEKILSGEIL